MRMHKEMKKKRISILPPSAATTAAAAAAPAPQGQALTDDEWDADSLELLKGSYREVFGRMHTKAPTLA